MPSQLYGASWHELQLPLTPVWIIPAVGVGLRNPVVPSAAGLPSVTVDSEDGLLDKWHDSQVVDVGRWDVVAPAGLVAGIATIFPTL